MTTAIASQEPNYVQVLEKVVTKGDLADLTPADRMNYYKHICNILKLRWETKPFAFLEFTDKKTGIKKVVLYALKECTEQIRYRDKCSAKILKTEIVEDVYCVWSETATPDGRTTEQLGAVSLKGMNSEDKPSAMKKAVTQSYRRGILTHAGLGFLDETEALDLPSAKMIEEEAK
jgi:hypothetical protein